MNTDLRSMKSTYEHYKKIGDKERVAFLDGVVFYCKHIGFDKDKTLFMLALIRNFLPEEGAKFSQCAVPDDIDRDFTKKILDTYDCNQNGKDL